MPNLNLLLSEAFWEGQKVEVSSEDQRASSKAKGEARPSGEGQGFFREKVCGQDGPG